MPDAPTVEQALALCQEILAYLLEQVAEKRQGSKQLHVMVADVRIDGQPWDCTTPSFGTVGATNPSDSAIDSWDAETCDQFAGEVKAQAEQAGGAG